MPNKSKQKGDRDELSLVHTAIEQGLEARRVPLSGAAEGFKGDVLITDARGKMWTVECKVRSRGFSRLYDWMPEYIDALTVRADRKQRLVVLREDTFFELIGGHDRDA